MISCSESLSLAPVSVCPKGVLSTLNGVSDSVNCPVESLGLGSTSSPGLPSRLKGQGVDGVREGGMWQEDRLGNSELVTELGDSCSLLPGAGDLHSVEVLELAEVCVAVSTKQEVWRECLCAASL